MNFIKILVFTILNFIFCSSCLAQQGSIADIPQEDGVEDTYYYASSCLHECMRQPSIIASYLSPCTPQAIIQSPNNYQDIYKQCQLEMMGISSEACKEWTDKLANTPITELSSPSITENPLYRQCAREARSVRDQRRNKCLSTCPNFYEEVGSHEALGLLNTINAIEHDKLRSYGSYTTDLSSLINFNPGQTPHIYAYKVGFVAPLAGSFRVPEAMNSDYFLQRGVYTLPLDAGARNVPFSTMAQYCPDCTATKSTFKAIAFSDLFGDGNLDVWTIDQTGQVTHVKDGFARFSSSGAAPFQPVHSCALKGELNIIIKEDEGTTRGNADYQYKLVVNKFMPNGTQPATAFNNVPNDTTYYGALFDADIMVVSGGVDRHAILPMGRTLEVGDIAITYNGIYGETRKNKKVGNFTMKCAAK